ncbi:hypothetical protein PUP75_15330 [Pseudomonas chlororaphis]|uniref:hypothetical protein n=1 Tax=Pseudomonas chlororaphis TaxID=587753 RepID=UPI002367C449|nr:hypothetical protein [Pseudomonas chlororaphis]WDH56113.1 hypothetical protein PUP75_15330 [Pseudomonas chlororaphis]
MLAPFTRSMTLTFGLCGAVLSPELLATSEPARNPDRGTKTLELDATSVTAQGLGATTASRWSAAPPA